MISASINFAAAYFYAPITERILSWLREWDSIVFLIGGPVLAFVAILMPMMIPVSTFIGHYKGNGDFPAAISIIKGNLYVMLYCFLFFYIKMPEREGVIINIVAVLVAVTIVRTNLFNEVMKHMHG